MHTRVQSGRVRGYRPTLSDFNELLELAQRGIDAANATAKLRYQRGSDVITSDKKISKIKAEHLSKLIKDSRESRQLTNVRFSSSQENPARRRYLTNLSFSSGQNTATRKVSIDIDPDGWTYYKVESSDFTWTLGRFHELTEMLLASRKLPAKAQFPQPQVLVSEQYRPWGAAALWTPKRDWRVMLVRIFKESPVWLPFFLLLAFKHSPKHLSTAQAIGLAGLALTYVAIVSGYYRSLTAKLRSYISIGNTSRSFLSLIVGEQADPAFRANLLVAVAGVIVATLAVILGR